jgi:hypothetical protein
VAECERGQRQQVAQWHSVPLLSCTKCQNNPAALLAWPQRLPHP